MGHQNNNRRDAYDVGVAYHIGIDMCARRIHSQTMVTRPILEVGDNGYCVLRCWFGSVVSSCERKESVDCRMDAVGNIGFDLNSIDWGSFR